jgi:RNA polymerase sigma-70 factor, ECF subfamily
LLLQTDDVALIARVMHNRPSRFRALLTLRELEGLSYRELAEVTGMPMGSVMSGLSRARQAFRRAMQSEWQRSGVPRRVRRTRQAETIATDAIGK